MAAKEKAEPEVGSTGPKPLSGAATGRRGCGMDGEARLRYTSCSIISNNE